MATQKNQPRKKAISTSGTSSRSGAQSRAKAPVTRGQQGRDVTLRTDIAGVVVTALGFAVLVAVLSSSSGVVTEALSWALFVCLGIGAYALAIVLIIGGLSFFLPRAEVSEGRVALGLSIILLTIVSCVALTMNPELIFDTQEVMHFGGFIGSAIAALLLKLAGETIAWILLIALGCVGLVITGLSFSRLIARISEKLAQFREDRQGAQASTGVSQRQERIPETRRHARGRELEDATSKPTSRGYAESTDGDSATVRSRDSKGDMPTVRAGREASEQPTVVVAPVKRTPLGSEHFDLPSFSLLEKSAKQKASDIKEDEREARQTADVIIETLHEFDVTSRVVDWIIGPTQTLFKIEVAKGVRLNKITALDNELALALAASTLRILAPIPGESLVGIEVPNAVRASVTLGDVLPPAGQGGPLELAIGKDVSGASVIANLAKMPHLLIGGSTGSGKSVAINAMIMGMIMRTTPAEVRLILIDPKRVEMTLYNDLPHLYVPVVTEPSEAAAALNWAVTEMERRLKIFSKRKVRDIGDYNEFLRTNPTEGAEVLPYLVIVIDELADLMLVAAKEVETSIVRLAQLARASGIHLIIATQRPEATVVTGLIKSNITNRIAFNVGSALDSRVILDESGAEKLVGQGDMLFSTPAVPKPRRIQGCYVSSKEISAVIDHLKLQKRPDYHEEILSTQPSIGGTGAGHSGEFDPLLWDAAEMIVASGLGSTSGIQRRFSIGYARAGRIMDMMTELGIVGHPDGSKPREVLLDITGLDQLRSSIIEGENPFEEGEQE